MTDAEARQLLEQKVEYLRALSYDELRDLLPRPRRILGIRFATADSLEETAKGASGDLYNLEAAVFWDDTPGGDVRVTVTCGTSDGDEFTDDFIMAPDGSFVGE